VEGAVNYIDPDNVRGTLPAGGVEWMQAGRGMWHGGGLGKAGRTRGFQLWIALPPELELGPTMSICQAPEDVPQDGPARVLLGSYGSASNAIASPSPINYLAVRLKAGERWRYEPARATPFSGSPSHRAFCRRLTNCGAGTSWFSSRRARLSNSKR
jgi:redox-sensitive bicupin YhaK (pirin superfamily)